MVERELGLAWVTVPPDALARHDTSADDLDGIVEYPRQIAGVRLALLFRQLVNGRIKVSFRSLGSVDAAEISQGFGGGGHRKAAGASIDGTLAGVQQEVLEASRRYLRDHPGGDSLGRDACPVGIMSHRELRGLLEIVVSRLSGLLLSIAVGLAAIPSAAVPRSVALPRPPVAYRGPCSSPRHCRARKPRIRLYGDYGPGSVAAPKPPPASEFANVVIYLDSVPTTGGWAGRAPGRLTIEQKGEVFVPHVLPVLRGSTVDFPNLDPVFHNVFSLSSARTFDLGRFPKGTSKSVRFDRAGAVKVFCHMHSDMSGVVLVLDNPFFTVPAPPGQYAIEGVRPANTGLSPGMSASSQSCGRFAFRQARPRSWT